MANLAFYTNESVNVAVAEGLKTFFLSMAMKFEHKGIVYVHQEKYKVGDLIRRLKLLWETAQPEAMLNHVKFL